MTQFALPPTMTSSLDEAGHLCSEPHRGSVGRPDAGRDSQPYSSFMTVFRRASLIGLIAGAVLMFGAVPVFAHGDGESDVAGDLVRQAIAVIVNEPGNMALAADKIKDALAAADTAGVDLKLVAQAGDALGKGDFHQARTLLELSIGARPHMGGSDPRPIPQVPSLAVGAETGIDVVTDGLAPHRNVTRGDVAALSGLIVLGALGAYLAVRFRPRKVAEV